VDNRTTLFLSEILSQRLFLTVYALIHRVNVIEGVIRGDQVFCGCFFAFFVEVLLEVLEIDSESEFLTQATRVHNDVTVAVKLWHHLTF
jgi:hypothetical protein